MLFEKNTQVCVLPVYNYCSVNIITDISVQPAFIMERFLLTIEMHAFLRARQL